MERRKKKQYLFWVAQFRVSSDNNVVSNVLEHFSPSFPSFSGSYQLQIYTEYKAVGRTKSSRGVTLWNRASMLWAKVMHSYAVCAFTLAVRTSSHLACRHLAQPKKKKHWSWVCPPSIHVSFLRDLPALKHGSTKTV